MTTAYANAVGGTAAQAPRSAADRVALGSPDNPDMLRRLCRASEWSRERLGAHRRNRAHAIKEMVGTRYSDNGSPKDVPVNLLEMMLSIYTHSLAARTPRVMVRGRVPALRAAAVDFEHVGNMDLRNLALGDTISRVVLDALLGLGVCKVGLEAGGEYVDPDTGETLYLPRPFAGAVDFEDWCHDMSARSWHEVAFCGDRYEVPLEVARANPEYDAAARNALKADNEASYAIGSDDSSVADITRSSREDDARLDPMVTLWDYCLPRQNLVVTVAADDSDYKSPLMVRKWQGPQFGQVALGPYHRLAFRDVPNQTMPLSMASLLMDLHRMANNLFAKASEQAQRQKTVTFYRGGGEDDAIRVRDAEDGKMVRSDDPGATKQATYGGADPTTVAMAMQARDLFSYFGGNLDVLGGLGAQTSTVGQDQLLAAQAGKRIEDMQARTVAFTRGVCRSIMFYRWHNPIEDVVAERVVPGFTTPVPVRFGRDQRRGEFPDYDIEIEPYSMQPQTPQSRLNVVTQVFGQFIAPMAPMLAEQGMTVDMEGLLRLVGRLTDMTELEEIVRFTGPPTGAEPKARGAGQAVRGPAETTRRYERVNRPGATRQGKDEVLMQTLMGGRSQASQERAAQRRVG